MADEGRGCGRSTTPRDPFEDESFSGTVAFSERSDRPFTLVTTDGNHTQYFARHQTIFDANRGVHKNSQTFLDLELRRHNNEREQGFPFVLFDKGSEGFTCQY